MVLSNQVKTAHRGGGIHVQKGSVWCKGRTAAGRTRAEGQDNFESAAIVITGLARGTTNFSFKGNVQQLLVELQLLGIQFMVQALGVTVFGKG
jgi:hypothetical protein